jgi:quinoprotein glucose dehydrogenase
LRRQTIHASPKEVSINPGGPMTTSGGLVFVAASVDNHLRAFDIEIGKLLWQAAQAAGAQGTPMSYESERKAIHRHLRGGHGRLGTKLGDAVAAFSLKEEKKEE